MLLSRRSRFGLVAQGRGRPHPEDILVAARPLTDRKTVSAADFARAAERAGPPPKAPEAPSPQRMSPRPRTVDADLLDALSGVPGLTLSPEAPLDRLNTFRIGGPAELLAEVDGEGALRTLLVESGRRGVRVQILGLGSNVLIPDEGLSGITARLSDRLAEVRFEGERGERVVSGAALALAQLARRAASQGLVGLEALAGFPSTVGGAVVMNAGCYGTEIKDVLVTARVVERDGRARDVTAADLGAGYRSTVLQQTGAVVVSAVFQLRRGDAAAALAEIQRLNRRRRASLPSGLPNVGSIFKNPPGDYAGRLIEACGLKGAARGGARISPKHANVIVNAGGARAVEVLELMLAARDAVAAKFGVTLEPEVVLTGGLGGRWAAAPVGAAGGGTADRGL